MQITIEYLLQFLGELLKDEISAEEKVRLIEAFYHAARNHVPTDSGEVCDDEEIPKEKRTKKEKNKEAGVAPLNPLAREASTTTETTTDKLDKLTNIKPDKMRRLVSEEFLSYIEQQWLLPKYNALVTEIRSPLTGAQYLSWLTRYPQELIDQKLKALESHPTHYGRVSVAATINDWLKQDSYKMTILTRREWLRKFRQQQPLILDMINQHLKPKRNGKQTTIDFDAAADAEQPAAAAESGDGGAAAQHADDHDGQPGLPDAQ